MDQKKYELTCLITPELNQSELEDFAKKINSLLSENKEFLKESSPQKINLAYPVQKKKSAFLSVFDFNTNPEQIISLKSDLEKEKNIIRFLIIKKEIKKEKKIRKIKKIIKEKDKVDILDFPHKGEPQAKREW